LENTGRSDQPPLDIVGDRHSFLTIGMVAVFIACALFALARLGVTLATGKLTPWWVNAIGALAIGGLYLWYRRNPAARTVAAASGTALTATIALVVPIFYGMSASIWWLSLVAFPIVLVGRRGEAFVWGGAIPLVAAAAVLAEQRFQIAGAAGEPLPEIALAKVVFVLLIVAIAAGFRRVVERRARELHESEERYRQLHDELEARVRERTEELRQSEEQLRHAQRMEAVGRLAGGLAHDLNNLMSVVLMSTDYLARDQGPRDEALRDVRVAAEQAADLTKQLLAFSRKQILQLRLVDLEQVVAGVGKILRRVIGEDIELVVACGEEVQPVMADPRQLEQVLMNLAVNARDAMPEGGKLRIGTEHAVIDEAAARLNPEVVPGTYSVLSVGDSGCGMDAETLSHIFEPFFTTKREGHGTGLGLATVYGIVTQSGGQISVSSEVGRGTTFKLYLPVANGAVAEVARAPVHPATGGKETVLVVEDDPRLRKVITRILRTVGYQILDAGSGEEAIALTAKQATPIDLLLTDVVMPGLNGRALAERLLATRPALKVIFMSGYTNDAIVRRGVHNAETAFLQKPFSHEDLARMVREALDAPAPLGADRREEGAG
jgi:signal transduction histidine kinase/ActR/RegA family two-component response regulator